MTGYRYRVYPTLLDAFGRYLRAPELYEERLRWADDDRALPDFRWEDAEGELIDRINRVPFESDYADRGTAFNNLVDRLSVWGETLIPTLSGEITEVVNGKCYSFNAPKLQGIANRYREALPQVAVERVIDTCHGGVLLYGFVDELMLDRIVDLKTTVKYRPGKYRHNWQHIVYPYCLDNEQLRRFDYDVYVFSHKGDIEQAISETYYYSPARDEPLLRRHVEEFIDFVESHRESITDKRIFETNEG